jgi:4-amino-4-deoxy-L-arabinose transferase-like glycosyltransferase
VKALLLLAVFVISSRALLWTPHAPNFDFANFALGVVRFAPEDHQPHPPGYPGVILLARAFAALGASPIRALHLTALTGSILALFGAYLLGRRLAGESAGLWSALLLTMQPVFFYSALTSPTRVFLAAGVTWFFYLLLELPSSLWLTSVALALTAGFRPELPFLLAVPFLVAARRAQIPWPTILRAALLTLLLSLPWLLWLSWSYGSPYRLIFVYYHYFLHHTGNTSPLLGAPTGAWQAMLRGAGLWNGPLALLAILSRSRLTLPFALYLLPALTIQLLFHLAPDAPDHTLGTLALLAVLAGASTRPYLAVPAAALFLAVSFAPPNLLPPDLDILSVRSFTASQSPIAQAIANLRASVQPNDAIVVLPNSPVSHRLLGPEFPDIPIYLLDPSSPALLHHYRQTPLLNATPDVSRYRQVHALPRPN